MAVPVVMFGVNEIIGCVLVGLASTLSVTVGLGGGSLFIPILMLLMHYDGHEATGLSQCMMVGASLATFIINVTARHPAAERPLLNLDLVLIAAPFQLAGTVLGFLINRLIPSAAILAILIVVMLFSFVTSTIKAVKLFKEERRAKKLFLHAEENANLELSYATSMSHRERYDRHAGGLMPRVEDKYAEMLESTPAEVDVVQLEYDITFDERKTAFNDIENSDDAFVEKGVKSVNGDPSNGCMSKLNPFTKIVGHQTKLYFMEADKKHSPMKWLLTAVLWALNFTFSFFRGSGDGTIDLIELCSTEYWLLIGGNVLVMMVFGVCWFSYASAISKQKELVQFEFVKGDVHLNLKTSLLLVCGGFGAGLYGGVAGVGGGIVLTPIFLLLNILPQVMVGATATLIFLSSSAAATIYLTGGMVPLDVAAVMFLICFFFSFLGKYYLDKWVKDHSAPSTIVFVFLLFLVIAVTSMSGSAISQIVAGTDSSGGIDYLCMPEMVSDL